MDCGINNENVTEFIRSLLPKRDKFLAELEELAGDPKNPIPIIHPEVGQLIRVLFDIKKPKTVLEVGTAIGYSSIFMAKLLEDVKIVTIERMEDMVNSARENVKKAGLCDRITIIHGEAKEILKNLQDTFDFIFLDGAKAQYIEFLPHIIRLLNNGGILFSDNILYKGMISSDELVIRRKITIVKRLRKYLSEISSHPLLDTSILPIGDGVAISYKKYGGYQLQ